MSTIKLIENQIAFNFLEFDGIKKDLPHAASMPGAIAVRQNKFQLLAKEFAALRSQTVTTNFVHMHATVGKEHTP